MSRYTKKDIIRMTEEEDVEFIRLQFTDIFGMLKNVAITAGQLEKALNNRCMFALRNPICTCIRTWIPLQFFHGDRSRARWHA